MLLRLIKLEFYYRLSLYHYKKSVKHSQKYVKHRALGQRYQSKHSKV